MVIKFTYPQVNKLQLLRLPKHGPDCYVRSLRVNTCRSRPVAIARNVSCSWNRVEGKNLFFKLKPGRSQTHFSSTTVVCASRTFDKISMSASLNTDVSNNTNIALSKSLGQASQAFDYFLVLDFEATCDNGKQQRPQEIIEFPVLKVNATTCKTESVFHQYVLPQYHPNLTPFCTELTGIVQEMVNDQPHLPEVLQKFNQWMKDENLLDPECKSIFITCGDWDLKTMLPKQCAYLDLSPSKYFGQWINIKKAFAEMTGMFPKGMMPMLQKLNLRHEGRHHSGIDDCHNIANILVAMIQQGFVFKQTGFLT